nr:hypothetical protein [uncultured Pseudodesulfovibrio sp.]
MKIFIPIQCTLVLLFSFCPLVLAGDVWRITSLDWQPFSDSKSLTQGSSIQKLRKLLENEGIELIVEFYPWARAQDIAQQENYVGYFPAWPEEVGEGFVASSPVDWSDLAVMTYVGSGLEWTGLEALFEFKVGLVKSYEYPDGISRYARKRIENVDATPNETALLRKLSCERIKVAITSPTVMFYLAEKLAIDNVTILKRVGKTPLVVAFRKTPENLKRRRLLEELLKKSEASELNAE